MDINDTGVPSNRGFDPEFAAAADWARLYRSVGVQIVPCKDKHPVLRTWREYQHALVPDEQFEHWYGSNGEFRNSYDMGMLTGQASGCMLMIDLDLYKSEEARRWWGGVLAIHNNRIEPETWKQATGGGGRQLFFTYPPNWRSAVNAKTAVGVDVRCQGGFAVLPPTKHASGKNYVWEPGCAPWEIDIALAPDWLLEEVERLIREHGGGSGALYKPGEKIDMANPGQPGQYDAFGHQTDGRETFMRDLVWGAVVDWHRECPIKPSEGESRTKAAEKYVIYEDQVSPRVYDPTASKSQLLDMEDRGPTEFWAKWSHAMKQWDSKVAEEAKQPGKGKDRTNIRPELNAPSSDRPLILTSKQFADTLVPPSYVIDGIIQRGYLYSLTARTGHGKTAVIMRAAAAIATGEDFAGCETFQGSVLYFAGENPQDVRARYVGMADRIGLNTDTASIYFIDGRLDIEANLVRIRREAEAIPDLRLVIIDTAAAYFQGDDGNSNAQLGAYAGLLRQLTFLPSTPTGIVNCHPIKNASADSLLPMGGSAFVNEVDGNLTLWADGGDKTSTLHWQGKFRGPEFDPISFELKEITSDRVKDEKGRLMPTVMAEFMPETVAERKGAVNEEDENILLRLIHADKHASFATLGKRAGFTKSKIQRLVRNLKDDKMVRKFRGTKYRVTKKGCAAAGIVFEGENDEE